MKTVNVIEAIFFAALDKQDATERSNYLDKACVGDADLRRCVEKLLNAQPKVGDFMRAPAEGLPQTTETSPDERPGTVLGPYKLLHDIGEGGMGTVWMAEQSEPVKRRVALKVIKPGMDSRQVLARFEAERQALALMDHPNIAKVLDAGATANGRPYFVMELVKGQPITEFCDKSRLTPRERLELFVPVCHAIQHAHQKGVIHRDIKPTNVLVALYDGKPVPKVIDFGVAKATAEPLTDKTLFTRHGQVVGTFEYMSPEQATLDQVDVDTRSDVYSLGVLLYELLTGTTPLEKERLRQAGLAEVLRLIREEEAPKPSTRLTSSPGLLATAAAFRKSDSQKLPKVVRGELDWIVMKALDKDRERRFVTPNGLARDIERYLKGEEVTACPPTLAYRVQKFARKNKAAFATASMVVAALLLGIALTGWQAVRATNAERATADEQDKTETALQDALQIGKERDARVVELQVANDRIHRDQAARLADQYAWDIQMIPLTLESGNVVDARRMLERQHPKLRHFEWHYWNGRAHTEHASVQLPGLPEIRSTAGAAGRSPSGGRNWVFSGDGTRIAALAGAATGTGRGREANKPTLLVWEAATGKLLFSHSIPVEVPEGTDGSDVTGNVSLSHDGKRVSLSATIGFLAQSPDLRAPKRLDGSYKALVRVFDVDSRAECFNPGTIEVSLRRRPIARLSPDGRKLILYTPPPGRDSSPRDPGRNAVWDLDAGDRKPVNIDNTAIGSLSPDGSRVIAQAAGMDDTRVTKVWDAASGQELVNVPHPTTVVPSPRWTYLATVVLEKKGDAGEVRILKIFDGTTGKEISSTPLTGALTGQAARGGSFLPLPVFSPDESLVAVPHNPTGPGRIDWYFVESRTGTIRRTIENPNVSDDRDFRRIVIGPRLFSGDGSQFIVCGDNAIHTFNVATGQPVHTFRGHVNLIVQAAPAPEDHLLRTIEAGGTLKEWDLRPPQAPPRIAVMEQPIGGEGGSGAPFGGAYTVSAGGERVAHFTKGPDDKSETVRVWDVAGNGPTILRARPSKGAVANRFGPGQLPLFLSADGKRVALFRSVPTALGTPREKFDPDNPPVSDVTVWDVATGKELRHVEFPGWATHPFAGGLRGISDDGATLCFTRMDSVELTPNGVIVDPKKPQRSTLWTIDVASGRAGPSITVDGNMGLPLGGALSPDGKRFASFVRSRAADGTWDNQFVVWDLVRGSQVFAVSPQSFAPGDSTGVSFPLGGAVFWSPDGSRVAVLPGSGASSIALLDAATGKLMLTLTPSTRGTLSPQPRIAFSPDGRRLACGVRFRNSGVVSVLDTDSGKEVLSLPLGSDAPSPGVGTRVFGAPLTFSPDGHRLHSFTQFSFSQRNGIDGTEGKRQTWLNLRTWGATPRPEPKQP